MGRPSTLRFYEILTDGQRTTNFVHGFPYVAISLGLVYKRHSVLGVIYNPFIDYLYSGAKGLGSHLTRGGPQGKKRKLPFAQSPKTLASLSQAQIAVEWGNDRSSKPLQSRSKSFHQLAGDASVEGGKMVHALRSLGSSALNFANVAQGGLDLYWCVFATTLPTDTDVR